MYLSSEKGGFKVSIIKGAGEGLICHRPKSTNVFIVGEGWVQGVNYKRGRGGADLFAIDQNPRIYLSSDTLRVGQSVNYLQYHIYQGRD